MRNLFFIACAFLLFGCGLESAGTAATVGKLEANQAKQAKESMDRLKASLDASIKEAETNAKKAEDPENN